MASSSCESSAPKTLTLVSSDGDNFDISESEAAQSVTIKHMVDDDCAGNPIPLPNVTTKTLAKVVEYLKKHADESVDADEKKKFDAEFISVDMYEIKDYILAANYLNISSLMDLGTQKIADMIKDKSPEWIRKKFGIENDFSEEEEKEVTEQNAWAFEGVKDEDD